MAIRLAPSILASDFSRLRDETHRCKQAGAELTDFVLNVVCQDPSQKCHLFVRGERLPAAQLLVSL